MKKPSQPDALASSRVQECAAKRSVPKSKDLLKQHREAIPNDNVTKSAKRTQFPIAFTLGLRPIYPQIFSSFEKFLKKLQKIAKKRDNAPKTAILAPYHDPRHMESAKNPTYFLFTINYSPFTKSAKQTQS